ncbi:MAG TPA: Bax inhibitor-1/YccA family protein [Gemmatimonadales bacterium]|nr:Bax inhibitor-1/YccA family protein [Gemmatimonadales bacterium]
MNPAFNAKTVQKYVGVAQGDAVMTVEGTVNKTGLLLALLVIAAAWTWTLALGPAGLDAAMPLMLGGLLGGLVFMLVTVFKKEWARVSAPAYAVCEGLFIGGLSAAMNTDFPGIVLQAVGLTFGVTATMLVLYRTGVIQVTQKFRTIVIAATGGIALYYVAAIVLGFFHITAPLIWDTGTAGILLSLFVIVIAAMNLALDFDLIEKGSQAGVPKYFEWYAAFGVIVTLVWLYLEILRLLGKRRR